MEWFATLKFDQNGLISVITQEYSSNKVLMMAYANLEALQKTIETGKVHYYSRSRQELWLKGETSGHFQHVKNIAYDCDQDALLIQVEQIGNACHTGAHSCFFELAYEKDEKAIDQGSSTESILQAVYDVIAERKIHPKEGSYTNYLFDKGIDKMLKKVGEETAEVIIAAKNQDKAELTYEASDLLYHLMVVMVQNGIAWNDIYKELEKRR